MEKEKLIIIKLQIYEAWCEIKQIFKRFYKIIK